MHNRKQNIMAEQRVTRDLTTGIGTISFPRVFETTKISKPGKPDSYEIQLVIPKTQRDDLRAILAAIQEVGKAKFGDRWKQVSQPLRNGDKERDELTEDGSTTKGEKYPERDGCYFLNARSTKPVGVYARDKSLITNPDDLYGGCKGRISVTFYPYSKEGNHGIGVALNGVQKTADGEPFGASRPTVDSMFDMLEDEDDSDLDTDDLDEVEEVEEEPTPPPAKKAAAKKAAPAKKAAAKKPAPEPEVEDLEDDLGDIDAEDDDLYEDLEG